MRKFIPLALCLSLLAVAPSASAVSIPTAKKWIKRDIRSLGVHRTGSIVVDNCRHGHTDSGRHRVLCDTYVETIAFEAWCGWGRVVSFRTFYRIDGLGSFEEC